MLAHKGGGALAPKGGADLDKFLFFSYSVHLFILGSAFAYAKCAWIIRGRIA